MNTFRSSLAVLLVISIGFPATNAYQARQMHIGFKVLF